MTDDDNADLAGVAGKAAHDFKNLLAIILGNTELLEEIATEDDARLMLKLIREAAERGEELAEMLAAAARDRL